MTLVKKGRLRMWAHSNINVKLVKLVSLVKMASCG